MSEGRVFQSNSTRAMTVVFSFMFVFLFLAGLGGIRGGTNHSTAIAAVGVAIMVVAVAGVAWSWLFFARMGVRTSDEGITIRNWLHQREVKWSDVQAFEFGNKISELSVRELLSSPYLQTYAVLNDGGHQVMSGLSASRMNRSKSRALVQALLDGLEEERLRHKGTGDPPLRGGSPM